jgi:ketosteroid isomerase-like protein
MGFSNAADAETAFYAAFSAGDHTALMAVWARSPDIVCIHPMGPRLTGLQSVAQSWALILANSNAARNIEIETKSRWTDAALAVHVVNEVISVPGSDARYIPVLATNVYRCIDNHWYMLGHHASVDAQRDFESPPAQTRH